MIGNAGRSGASPNRNPTDKKRSRKCTHNHRGESCHHGTRILCVGIPRAFRGFLDLLLHFLMNRVLNLRRELLCCSGRTVRARRVRWRRRVKFPPIVATETAQDQAATTATGYRRPRGLRSQLSGGLLALSLTLPALLIVLGFLRGLLLHLAGLRLLHLAGLRLLLCSAVRCLRRRDRWLCRGLKRSIVVGRLRSVGRLQLLRVVGSLLIAALAARALRSARVVDGYAIALIGSRVGAAVVPVRWAAGHIRRLHRERRPITGTTPGAATSRSSGSWLPSGAGQRRKAYPTSVIQVDHHDPGHQDRRHRQHRRGPSQPRRQPQ